MRSAFQRYIFVFLFSLAAATSSAIADVVHTFDTASQMNAVLDLDVLPGDRGTQWRTSNDAGFSTPSVHFNYYNESNSIRLKDTSVSILSFEYSEWQRESTTGNNWTWSFYDAAGQLVGTRNYVNTGNRSVQFMDLVALGLVGVTTVQLDHVGGWMNIDNLRTSAIPVPAAVWLFGSALAGLGWLRRRQAQ